MPRYRLLVTVVLLLVSGQVFGEQLKIATIAPDGSTWMKEARKAADEVAEKTEGRVSFRFYPGGTMGNEAMVLRKMRVGQLHGGVFVAGSFADIEPNVQAYTLPLMFRSYAEVDHVRKTVDAELIKKLESKGFVTFGFIEGGFAHLMTVEPASTFAELKGLKAWIPEGDTVGSVLVEEAGLSPVPLPLPDVLTGLQTGLLEGVTAPPIAAVALQWFTKARYLLDLPVIYTYGCVTLSKRSFDRLAPGDQKAVREALEKMTNALDQRTREDNEGAAEALRAQGVVFTPVSEQVNAEWNVVAAAAAKRLSTELKLDPAVLAEINTLLEQFREKP
jgi:TRAP-type C4-dicarboxylate transport system substrate-binding protein